MNLSVLLTTLEASGKEFSVTFTKANGEERSMVARFGVTKHLKGGVKTYNGVNNDKGNIGVFESLRNADGTFTTGKYKCFNINRVKSIKVDGNLFTF